jgi:hypothetical protein
MNFSLKIIPEERYFNMTSWEGITTRFPFNLNGEDKGKVKAVPLL